METNITTYQQIREYEKLDTVNTETHSGGNDVPSGEKVSSSEA